MLINKFDNGKLISNKYRGVFCDNVFIKDMQLNKDIANEMAAVAK